MLARYPRSLCPNGTKCEPSTAPSTDQVTKEVFELLKDLPEKASRTNERTTLEFKGQWHPKPNGAETGHGVVPTDWALATVSENDRALATYDWAGGAALCLSNAFGEANRIEAQADDLIAQGFSEDHPHVQGIRMIARASEEREAVMRKQWIDIDFQEGEAENEELLHHLERDFATQLITVAKKQCADNPQEACKSSSSQQEWFYIKVLGGTCPGKTYLSATFVKEEGDVRLHGYDDESGRQRWKIEACGDDCFHLRLAGGTRGDRRLLGKSTTGETALELCAAHDGSGRQRWRLTASQRCSKEVKKRKWYSIQAFCGGAFLFGDKTGSVALQDLDDGSGCARWVIPEWCDPAVKQEGAPKYSSRDHELNEAAVIAIRSGAEDTVTLANLRPEQMTRVLNNNRCLGAAIDLVGCYLKNYEIDKADRLCQRIEPLVRERGGLWLFKFLNEYTVVKMKQGRYQEALVMYDEYELLIGYEPEEQWELFDTVYRNFGWIHCSMGNYEKSLHYFKRCVEIKRKNNVPPHWFDQWDLGKTHARLCLSKGNVKELVHSIEMIKVGIELHQQVEQQDKVMLCKMLNSAGECATVIGDYSDFEDAHSWYEEGVRLHRESYEIYVKVLGKKKPLTGWCMENLAGALRKVDTPESKEEAKELLLGALAIECSKDIIKLSSMERLLGSVLDVHSETEDLVGLARCQDSINTGLDNLRKRRVDVLEAASYAALLKRIVQVLFAHAPDDNMQCCLSLLEEAQQYAKQAVTAPKTRSQHTHTARLLERIIGSRSGGAAEAWVGDDQGSELFVPKAGSQEIADIDANALLEELQRQLALLSERAMGKHRTLGMTTPVKAEPIEALGSYNISHWERVD